MKAGAVGPGGPGDVPLTRGTQRVPRFRLDSGRTADVTQSWVMAGRLNERRDNLVVVFHSLTGSPETLGGWLGDVVGPGRAIDTDRWAVLSANLLGSCYGTSITAVDAVDAVGVPEAGATVTTRDMARLVAPLVAELGVSSVALATGGSLGGMVALEWAASFPGLSRSVVVFAAPAAHTAWGIGWNHVQRVAIQRLGADGLALARMAGMLTYRSPAELEERFGRRLDERGPFAVQGYLSRHGEKLVSRFDVPSYLALLDAMDTHDVSRGRGSVRAALSPFQGRLVGVGIPGDRLYGDDDVQAWVREAGAVPRRLFSRHGHDGFLLEAESVGVILREALRESARAQLREAS